MSRIQRTPVLFVSHGAPTKALDRERGAELRAWASQLPRPEAILVISAHWWEHELQISDSARLSMIYDFAGFPPELWQIQYPAPSFSASQRALVQSCVGPVSEVERGLDHGAWVPLMHLFPDADIPILPIALPLRARYPYFFALGQKLAPLREQGIMILASGAATHNLGAFDEQAQNSPAWVTDFDRWLQERLLARDKESLLDPRRIQPLFRKNHPTDDHYAPLLVALGAAWDGATEPKFPIHGFEQGSLSCLCVQFD